jgi:hypothetical protein
MNVKTLSIGTAGLAGLVAAGLLALPVTASAAGSSDDLKRNEDNPDIVLLADDDDDDDTGRDDTTDNGGGTNSRSGDRSGRDNSADRSRIDWTRDGKGDRKVDHSRNQTNDRSRHNTRG